MWHGTPNQTQVACSLPPDFETQPAKAAEAAVAYVVLADERQRPHLHAAQCTWLRKVEPARKPMLPRRASREDVETRDTGAAVARRVRDGL